ncbi:MAG: hypothetical protein J0I84_24525, partial [Terrimonas sp.]|nr:hypothetical protein [Terrimonas sp.]
WQEIYQGLFKNNFGHAQYAEWSTDKTDIADIHGMYRCLSVSSVYSVCYSIKVFVVMLNHYTHGATQET